MMMMMNKDQRANDQVLDKLIKSVKEQIKQTGNPYDFEERIIEVSK
jgi:hypothetical protein